MAKGHGRLRNGAGPRSLRAQLALFALSILAPALLCMAALLLNSVAESRKSHERELLATARALSAAVDQDLSWAMAANEVLSTSDAVLNQDWSTLRRRAKSVSEGDGWMALHDATGRRIFNTSPLAGPDPVLPPPAAYAARPAPKARHGVVTDLTDDPATGRKVIAVQIQMQGSGGPFTLSHVVDPARFVKLPAMRRMQAPAMVTIVDRTNRVVARSRMHERFLGASATGNMIEALKVSNEGVVRSRNLEGVSTVVAFTRSPLSGWATLVVMPRAVFEAPLYRNIAFLALISLATLTFGAGAAFFYSRTIGRELAVLEDDAAALGHGEIIPARAGLISNFASLQLSLTRASEELTVRSERQRLMINELNHRVKNTLATVQSLAVQTFRGSETEAVAKFDTRLAALASGHDLLTQTNWKDVALAEVVARCAAPGDVRVTAEGPPVTLPPQAALALCMCLHELTTNSLKYGALSAQGGALAVTWTLDQTASRPLILVWRESGGPRVQPPSTKGFGTRLIDRLLRHELGGDATRDFAPGGLVLTAHISLAGDRRWDNDFV